MKLWIGIIIILVIILAIIIGIGVLRRKNKQTPRIGQKIRTKIDLPSKDELVAKISKLYDSPDWHSTEQLESIVELDKKLSASV